MNIPQDFEPVVETDGKATKRWYEWFLDNYAYTPYTPTVTASSGTFTTVSATGRHKKRGRTVFINIVVTITTVGTASGAVQVTLPFVSAAVAQIISGRETAVGTQINGLIGASASMMQILEYDATTIAASGRTLVLSGSYESAT